MNYMDVVQVLDVPREVAIAVVGNSHLISCFTRNYNSYSLCLSLSPLYERVQEPLAVLKLP